jgi:hypothetical protein
MASLVLAAVLTACSRVPIGEAPAPLTFSIRHFTSASTPSPLNEVRTGQVRAVFPESWEARPLPATSVPQEGFVASPRIDRFERGVGAIQGIEAFWVDVAKLKIPSNYYYLAARNEALSALTAGKCRAVRRDVLIDRPPDFTGRTFSPSDYVVSATGTCDSGAQPTRWAYVVAAPGFGPVRQVGLPTSGLYVVVAVVSGRGANRLLHEMLDGAQFGGTPISQIVRAAGRIQ